MKRPKLFIGWRLLLLSFLLFVPFFSWAIIRTVKSQHFDDECQYHINEALSSTDLNYASSEMDKALSYIRSHQLTNGFTSIIDRRSDENVEWWYEDLQTKRDYIHGLSLNHLKRDQAQPASSEYVKIFNYKQKNYDAPDGISIYPYNTSYFVWAFLSVIMFILGVIGLFVFAGEKGSS